MAGLDTVIVTGSAGSIGSAICAALVQRFGSRLIAIDLNPDGLDCLRSTAGLQDAEIEYHVQDATDWAAAAEVVSHACDTYGAVDALVTTAGGHQSRGLVHEPYWLASKQSIDMDVTGNLMSTMGFVHAALGRMVNAGHGNVVCIASGKGLKGGPGVAAYSAAKSGVVGLVQATAVEAGPYGVRINAIAPGGTEARWRNETAEAVRRSELRVPLQRRTRPDDVANAAAFLMSDDASHITGTCLDITGGTLRH